MQEAENSGEGLSEGEMKKILLSKLTPETKQKIRDSQADQKVLGNWVEVRGVPETMGKMAVRELLHSISATGLKDITIREGRWRVGFHDSEQSEFFCSMVDGKVKYKGTVLKVPMRFIQVDGDRKTQISAQFCSIQLNFSHIVID